MKYRIRGGNNFWEYNSRIGFIEIKVNKINWGLNIKRVVNSCGIRVWGSSWFWSKSQY
jgi:hypothetical protein